MESNGTAWTSVDKTKTRITTIRNTELKSLVIAFSVKADERSIYFGWRDEDKAGIFQYVEDYPFWRSLYRIGVRMHGYLLLIYADTYCIWMINDGIQLRDLGGNMLRNGNRFIAYRIDAYLHCCKTKKGCCKNYAHSQVCIWGMIFNRKMALRQIDVAIWAIGLFFIDHRCRRLSKLASLHILS